MKCRKCRVEIPDDCKFCPQCGAKVTLSKHTKSRGNGTGSVYKRGKVWVAAKTTGYYIDGDGKVKRVVRTKSGFKTKREAQEYLPLLTKEPAVKDRSFKQVYDIWQPTHQAGASTMGCYSAAMNYFKPVWAQNIATITIDDLQDCMDDCPKGKRTQQNMKALCGLLYKYAIPRHLARLNMAEFLRVGGESGEEREGLPLHAVKALEANQDTVPNADYVLCQCYLGFRPSEFLDLDVAHYDRPKRAFTGGAKTEAGRNRVVTVSPKIQPIIDRLTKDKIGGPVFCGQDGARMPLKTYRAIFYRVLEQCGIENPIEGEGDAKRRRYTPHSCRHTFATLMKNVTASDKDKLALIGHTSTEMLRHYQDVNLEDLRKITDAI